MSPCPAWGEDEGRGSSWWGNCGPGRFLLSLAGGRARRVPQPSSTHSSSLWRLERPPGRVGVGALTPAQYSSDFHYVWQRLGLCVLGGSGLQAHMGRQVPGLGGAGLCCFSSSLSVHLHPRGTEPYPCPEVCLPSISPFPSPSPAPSLGAQH